MIEIKLPMPPSTNNLWRNVVTKGRRSTLLSRAARTFYNKAQVAIAEQGMRGRRIEGRVAVNLIVYPRNSAKFDIDNRIKAPLDALTKSGVWLDDSQVDDIRIRRGDRIVKSGLCIVSIEVIKETAA